MSVEAPFQPTPEPIAPIVENLNDTTAVNNADQPLEDTLQGNQSLAQEGRIFTGAHYYAQSNEQLKAALARARTDH